MSARNSAARGIAQALLERVTAAPTASATPHTDVAAASTSKTVAGLTRLYLRRIWT